MESFGVSNIVVAVDFSKYSKVVLNQALTLVKKFKARLHVVYVIEDVEPIGLPEVYTNAFRYNPEERAHLKERLLKFYRLQESSEVSVIIKSGAVVKTVTQIADKLEPSMIVIGSVGKSLFNRFVLGSHAESIALTAKQPVWVHRGSKIRHFKHMLFPVDLSVSSQRVIEFFKSVNQKYKFAFNYLYVQTEQMPIDNFQVYAATVKMLRSMRQRISKAFSEMNPGKKLKVIRGDVVGGIAEEARNYDLVVMCPHNKSGFFRNLGRTTAKVIRVSPVPVLIIKPS